MSARPDAAVASRQTGRAEQPDTSPRGEPGRWRSLTVAIATHQRREPLLRLLTGLADQLRSEPDLQEGLDVVVVVDGSTDGSYEAARALPLPVPVTVLHQANAGLAATRNAGRRAARGEVVWFLDDDLVPGPGLVRRHREAHPWAGPERVVVGPCLLVSDEGTTDGVREWWQLRYDDMAAAGIQRFDQFSAANTSLPVALLDRVGGFDERFVGYGREDYELGLRLLDSGAAVEFAPAAVAVHEQVRTPEETYRLRREEGRNVVRFAEMHPHRSAELLDARPPGRLMVAVVRSLRVLVVPLLRAVLRVVAARPAPRSTVSPARSTACYALGVLEQDRTGRVTAALLRRR